MFLRSKRATIFHLWSDAKVHVGSATPTLSLQGIPELCRQRPRALAYTAALNRKQGRRAGLEGKKEARKGRREKGQKEEREANDPVLS